MNRSNGCTRQSEMFAKREGDAHGKCHFLEGGGGRIIRISMKEKVPLRCDATYIKN